MTEFEFIKEIVFRKYPFRISILALSELLGATLVVAGVGTILPLIATLVTNDNTTLSFDGRIGELVSFLGLSTASPGRIITLLVIILAGQFVIDAFRQYMSAIIGISLNTELKKEINSKITNASWQYYLTINQGKYLQCMIQESSLARGAVNDLGSVIANVILLCVLGVTIAYFSLTFFIIILIASPVIILMSHLVMKGTKTLAEERIRSQSYLNNFMIDNTNIFKIIKAEGTEKPRIEQAEKTIDLHRHIEIKQLLYNIFVTHFYNILMLIGIAGLSYVYLNFNIANGSTFLFNLLLMQRCGAYLKELQTKRKGMLQKIPSYDSCKKLIASIPAQNTDTTATKQSSIELKNDLTLHDIDFSYNSTIPLIRNLSLALPSRGLIGFVGESGGGKTTIADILIGLLPPNSGSIHIDNTLQNLLSNPSWQNMITYVPQNAYLFQGTLKENLLFGINRTVTDDEIFDALDKAHCHEFITTLPQGLDTPLKSGDKSFSGGERQRLCIARALLRTNPLIILDEPSSSLDKKSEYYIQNTLEKLKNDHLIIVITHSLNFVENFDTIHVVEGGTISWSGTYTELKETPYALSSFQSTTKS